MIPFRLFLERKKRNPLRQETLTQQGRSHITSPEFLNTFKNYYKKYPIEDMFEQEDILIKKKYDNLLKSSEELADRYLDSEMLKIIDKIKRPTTKEFKKVYEYQGVQVFVDEENVNNIDFSPGSYNYRMVKHNVMVMLVYVRDILPNRKPKIIITDLSKNKHTKDYTSNNPEGMAYSKHIFLDQYHFEDSAVWVHEYAHYAADLIPDQTQKMLINAFEKFLGMYYKGGKLPKSGVRGLSNTQKNRIAAKFGFPEYGLTNHDEFFAVLIENWKQLPNNKLTYKFKSLVKNVLTRL